MLPSVGLKSPGPTTAEPFAPEALYELKIDADGDAAADIAYQVRFASSEGQGIRWTSEPCGVGPVRRRRQHGSAKC
jgi:hypothetical protein